MFTPRVLEICLVTSTIGPTVISRWAASTLHGRGTPPPERLWLRLAQLMGWQGDGVLAAFTPLPADAEDTLARFG
jgi:hypothetical protein